MDSNAECRRDGEMLQGIISSRHVDHQRRAGEESEAVSLENAVGYSATHAEIVGVDDQAFFRHCSTRLTIRGIFPPGKTSGSSAISAVTRIESPSKCCSSSRIFIISWAARSLPATARTTTRSERSWTN